MARRGSLGVMRTNQEMKGKEDGLSLRIGWGHSVWEGPGGEWKVMAEVK